VLGIIDHYDLDELDKTPEAKAEIAQAN